MGGKGQRRREKNYRAAHGGHSRLPPPPDRSAIDALPSKLRKLMAFTSSTSPSAATGTEIVSNKTTERRNKRVASSNEKELSNNDGSLAEHESPFEDLEIPEHVDASNDKFDSDPSEKKKKKKKRKRVTDLRFEKSLEEVSATSSKKKERKKKYLEAKKNKKKAKIDENADFPGREEIKFGEVVQAPPKLTSFPKKVFKTVQDASRERLRLQAVEAYRNRKGWVSRPGVDVPAAPSL